MSGQLQVASLESTQSLTTNGTITVGQTTINSTSINLQGSGAVINGTAVAVGNSSQNTVLNALISDNAIFVGNTNYFPAPLDIFSWASAAGLNNCTISRDTTITSSPAGGIPFKITPTGSDPHPGTISSNTWNLFPIAPGDVIKTSGYIRIDIDGTLAPSTYLLNLPANTIGGFGTLTKTDQVTRINATSNEWYYFEVVTTITGSNSGFMQIRPDGVNGANTWYDGISVEKGTRVLVSESVNTQIFTANGTWGKPSWANTGNELVVVHMWGGGGGGSTNATAGYAGGGGAFSFGYFKASQCNAVCNVVVGLGGTAALTANPGTDSIFYSNTTVSLSAFGGGGGNQTVGGGGTGGGWLSRGASTTGGGPLGGTSGTTGTDSTFGGGGGTTGSPFNAGSSVYGGGGGGASGQGSSGRSIYGGGGGGGAGGSGGTSIYGGAGGKASAGAIPGGGGDASFNGARGEVRVYTYRITG
jgi:hypothetical protein